MDHTTNGPTALARPADRESLQLFVKLPDLKNVQLTNGFDLVKRSNGNRVFSQNRKTKSSFLVPQNSCHCSLLGLQSKCIPAKQELYDIEAWPCINLCRFSSEGHAEQWLWYQRSLKRSQLESHKFLMGACATTRIIDKVYLSSPDQKQAFQAKLLK